MPPVNTNVASGETYIKMGKFKASTVIVAESWEALKKDKEIIFFPIISGVLSLGVFAAFAAYYFFKVFRGHVGTEEINSFNQAGNYGVLLGYTFLMILIVNFFTAALMLVVQARFEGKDFTFSDGLTGASKRFFKIFIWSLISATVGVVLRIISDKSSWVGKIVIFFLGSAWNILTIFSLPALVIADLGVKNSFKESAAIIRKNWGEYIIINFGVGIFFFGLLMVIFILGACAISIFGASRYLVFPLLALSIIVISILSSTLGSIFKLALFNYARTGVIPQGFSSVVVQGAIQAKK